MLRSIALAVALLFTTQAAAQQAFWLETSPGKGVGFAVGADGTVTGFTSLIQLSPTPPNPPDPPDPPSPNSWNVTGGLHVLICDDENLRGKLPQSQINIFTSSLLRQWLDKTCPKASDGRPSYRLSSNDSLADGGEARKQELPVYVQGWDLLMKSGVTLPAWIVANGKKTTIEPLPKTVEAAIARLEALK